MFDLTGMTALVTGASGGIGSSIARALAAQGATLALSGSNEEKLKAFAAELGGDHKTIVCNLSDPASVDALVPQAVEALGGKVDILVNNAGITRDASLAKMSPQDWTAVLDTNLTGCFNMTQAVFGGMRARKWGRIVSISSINGEVGQFGQTNYAASKAGILGFTRSLALEGARAGVTVNAIAPGYTDTDMVRAVPSEILQKIVERIPVGRLATPAEIARCVVFLVAEDAGFVTGATFDVNGGQYMA